ncbi:MAG TPA: hypothetical protein VJ824_01210 [Bacillota bacterium]|nr:hypothetical protein [Bacillota bacterium]
MRAIFTGNHVPHRNQSRAPFSESSVQTQLAICWLLQSINRMIKAVSERETWKTNQAFNRIFEYQIMDMISKVCKMQKILTEKKKRLKNTYPDEWMKQNEDLDGQMRSSVEAAISLISAQTFKNEMYREQIQCDLYSIVENNLRVDLDEKKEETEIPQGPIQKTTPQNKKGKINPPWLAKGVFGVKRK